MATSRDFFAMISDRGGETDILGKTRFQTERGDGLQPVSTGGAQRWKYFGEDKANETGRLREFVYFSLKKKERGRK